jgi:hypothetical protein
MTKQDYIHWKTSNPINVLYHYYTTHEKLDHRPLDPQMLVIQLQVKGWNINEVMRNIIQQYDEKFEIVSLLDKNGNLIKYL